MNVLMYYEHKLRELSTCYCIKEALETLGHTAVIFNINFENLRAEQYAKKNTVDIIIVPWCYQKTDFYPIIPILKNSPKARILNLHCEQISAPMWECALYKSDELAQKYVYHIAWGDAIKDKMISYGIPHERIFVTGNIRAKAYQGFTREQLSKKYGLDYNKKWILFAETRDTLSTRTVKSLKFYEKTQGLDFEMAMKEIEIGEKNLQTFWQQVANLSNSFFEKFEFIYRPHPGGVIPRVAIREEIKIISDYPIQVWFDHIWLDISYSSISTFEADAAGVPCLIHEPNAPFLPSKTTGLEEYPIIKNLNEITEDLIERVRLEEDEKKIYKKYIGSCDNAVENTIQVIFKLFNLEIKYPSHLFLMNKKRIARQKLFEIITYFVVKLNLLNAIKYPHSAFKLKLDIPYYRGT